MWVTWEGVRVIVRDVVRVRFCVVVGLGSLGLLFG